MSNQKALVHDVTDGPNKEALSLSLFYPEELKDPTVSFTFQWKGRPLNSYHNECHSLNEVERTFQVVSVKNKGAGGHSFEIIASHESYGEVLIRFNAQTRKGKLKFLNAHFSHLYYGDQL